MASRRMMQYGAETMPMPPMTAAGRPGGGLPMPRGGQQAQTVPPPTPIPDYPEDPSGGVMGQVGQDMGASGGLAGLLPLLLKALAQAQQGEPDGQQGLPSRRVMGANPLTPGPTVG